MVVFCGLALPALGGDFYGKYRSLVDTNRFTQPLSAFPALVDTNNSGIKVTNAVLDLGNLKQRGEISGVRLGMTMQEVIDCWGKPRGGWSRCVHGLITFFYSDASLGFEGDRLETITLSQPTRFAAGLSTTSTVDEFVRALGSPSRRRESGKTCNLVYLSPGASLRLDFHEDELMNIYLERTPNRAEPWKQPQGANPQGRADGGQPSRPETNQTSAAAAPRRSP